MKIRWYLFLENMLKLIYFYFCNLSQLEILKLFFGMENSLGFISFQVYDFNCSFFRVILANFYHLFRVYKVNVNGGIIRWLIEDFQNVSIRVDVNQFVLVLILIDKLSQKYKSVVISPFQFPNVFHIMPKQWNLTPNIFRILFMLQCCNYRSTVTHRN